MAMQQATSVPKSIVDTISAVFIIIATMDFVIELGKRRKMEKEMNATVDVEKKEKGGEK